jgi:hypothetical protein
VTAPSGKEETATLDKGERGLWRKALTASEQGVYRVSSGQLASVVTVGNANARELSAVTATDEALSPVIDETGGGSFWLGREDAEAAKLPRLVMLRGSHVMHGDDWLGLHKRDAYHVKGVRLFPLHRLSCVGLLLGVWPPPGSAKATSARSPNLPASGKCAGNELKRKQPCGVHRPRQ